MYKLVKDFPELMFTINGGINSLEEVQSHIQQGHVQGCMIGRHVVNNPFYWRHIDSSIYNKPDPGKQCVFSSRLGYKLCMRSKYSSLSILYFEVYLDAYIRIFLYIK